MKMKPEPQKPLQTLIALIIVSIGTFIVFFFFSDDASHKTAGLIVPPLLIGYGLYAFFREKKADSSAVKKKPDLTDGSYFSSAEWREKYLSYVMENPFETIDPKGMKADLCRRYRRRKYVGEMIFGGFFAGISLAAIIGEYFDRGTFQSVLIFGIALGGLFLYFGIVGFTAKPVRKWLRSSGAELRTFERSYMSGKMVSHKINGINLGRTHIIIYTEKEIHTIENSLVDSITRKIVRLKKYENSIYAGDEYLHYAVVTFTYMNRQLELTVELNEFQVEMIIEEFSRSQSYRNESSVKVSEKYDNNIVT